MKLAGGSHRLMVKWAKRKRKLLLFLLSLSHLFLHLLGDEVVLGEIPSEGPEAARVVEGGAADEAGHARHAVDAEQARDQVDARQPRPEVDLTDKLNEDVV